jgi:hypothetical protein
MRLTSRRGSRNARQRTTRLRLEQLEDRAVPAFAFASAFRFGGTSSDNAYKIASDSAGYIYVTGRFQGTAFFDATHSLTTATYAETFVAKFDSSGTCLWATDVGPNGRPGSEVGVHDTGTAAGADAVYVAWSGAVWDGSTRVSNGDLHVARLDAATGAPVWSVQLTSPATPPGDSRGSNVVVGASGSVYVSGDDTVAGTRQAVVARLDPLTGLPIWTVATSAASTGSWVNTADLQMDASETYLYQAGSYNGTADFNPDPGRTATLTSRSYTTGNGANKTTVASQDAFVWKLTTGGAHVWAGSLGSSGTDWGYGLSLDGAGGVNLGGLWNTNNVVNPTVDFDPGPGIVALTSQGGLDNFLVHLVSTDGGQSYTTQASAGGWAKDQVGGITVKVDGSGNIYNVTGTTLNKFSPSGTLLAAATVAGDGHYGIWDDASGAVYLTGNFFGTTDFDPTPGTFNLTSVGQDDCYVVKLTQFTPPPPQITISDVAALEGRNGTRLFVFTVSLSWASDDPVTVSYATANGTATAGSDYQAQSGTLTFAPGEFTKTITIVVNGDKTKESDESFFVNLFGAFGGTILDGQGLGTILNDD